MDFVGMAIDLAIKGAEYLATLPEQDRQKVIAQWKTQAASTAVDVGALSGELDTIKAEHAALKAEVAALKAANGSTP